MKIEVRRNHPTDYPEASRRTIWNFRQNHPELVIRDLREYLGLSEEDLDFVRTVLLARGINKWLKVRRDLIAYKKQLRHDIKRVEADRCALPKGHPRRRGLLEKSKALQSVRATLKTLCQTDRWQIWPRHLHIGEGLKAMNTLRASDQDLTREVAKLPPAI